MAKTTFINAGALRDVSYLTIGTLLAAGASFGSQTLAARMLGPSSFGVFASALNSVNLLGPVAAFGVAGFLLKAFGQEQAVAVRWVRPAIALCVRTTLISSLLLMLWLFLQSNAELRIIGLILMPLIGAQALIAILIALYQSRGDYLRASVMYGVPHSLRLGMVALLFVVPTASQSVMLACLYALTSVSLIGYCAWRIAPHYFSSRSSPTDAASVPTSATVARESWKFGLDGVLYLAYHQLGVVVILFALGSREAGLFGAAFLFLSAAYMFPSVIFQRYLLPKLHYWARNSPHTLMYVATRGTLAMFAAGGVIFAILYAIAEPLMELVFSGRYDGSAHVLKLLAMAIPLKYAASSMGSVLTSGNLLEAKLWVMAVAAVLYAPLCYCLAIRYGLPGAAVATVVIEGLLLCGFAVIVGHKLQDALSA